MADSIRRNPAVKPRRRIKKPRPNFPLGIYQGSGYWCKKVRGRVFCFGKISDDLKGVAALELWLEQRDDLLAGREPRVKTEGLTVADLCNQFLAHKEQQRDDGKINSRTWRGYYDTCVNLGGVFGKNRTVSDLVPDDFRKLRTKLAKTR